MRNFQSRQYQTRVVDKAVDYYNKVDSVLIESPTGSGKTFMGLRVADHMAREFGYTIGWCAIRRELLANAAEAAEKFGFEHPIQYISMFDKNPPSVDFLVVDEAQHDSTSTMENLHVTVRPKKVLGLSATPERTDHVELYFTRRIKDAGIAELVKAGYLSQYTHFTIDSWNPTTVAFHYFIDRENWFPSVMYFRTRPECDEAAAYLRSQGFDRFHVVTADSNRELQLQDFKENKVDLLINMMVLTEGWDCPKLKTAFVRDGSKSPTVQMGGRVFRAWPEYDKQIVQSRVTHNPFTKLVVCKEQYLYENGRWMSSGVTEDLENIIHANRMAIVAVATKSVLEYACTTDIDSEEMDMD